MAIAKAKAKVNAGRAIYRASPQNRRISLSKVHPSRSLSAQPASSLVLRQEATP